MRDCTLGRHVALAAGTGLSRSPGCLCSLMNLQFKSYARPSLRCALRVFHTMIISHQERSFKTQCKSRISPRVRMRLDASMRSLRPLWASLCVAALAAERHASVECNPILGDPCSVVLRWLRKCRTRRCRGRATRCVKHRASAPSPPFSCHRLRSRRLGAHLRPSCRRRREAARHRARAMRRSSQPLR